MPVADGRSDGALMVKLDKGFDPRSPGGGPEKFLSPGMWWMI